jgi:membrane protein DedA with SNARE-associated domain
MGLPFLPGETTLLATAALSAGAGGLSIGGVIGAAVAGAVVGGLIGFWLGRAFGYRLLLRYGPRVGLDQRRLKLGIYLFKKYGGAVIVLGRFVPLLRSLFAFLAGANRMSWARFMAYNVLGAFIWAGGYGYAAHVFGKQIKHVAGPVGLSIAGLIVLLLVLAWFLLRRHENRLADEAEREMPGPLDPDGHHWPHRRFGRHADAAPPR